MKTNPSLRIIRLATLAPLAVAIAAVLLTQPVSAVPVTHSIVITENSSTSLTATYDGSTSGVTVHFDSGAFSFWDITFPSSVRLAFGALGAQWLEPENSSLGNVVVSGLNNTLSPVASDFSGSTYPAFPDESTVNNFGTDNSDGGSISVTFDDDVAKGEATVPETGSSFGLLLLGLSALFGANRLRSFRSA
jgi:hypothetical protein